MWVELEYLPEAFETTTPAEVSFVFLLLPLLSSPLRFCFFSAGFSPSSLPAFSIALLAAAAGRKLPCPRLMVPPAPHKPLAVLDPRNSVDSCAFHLHSWRPFLPSPTPPDPDPCSSLAKRPCLSDRATSFSLDSIDLSRLSLLDDTVSPYRRTGPLGLLGPRKRRRRRGASRSVSGRSSDRSANRRCCSIGASAAHGTCSDFPVAIGTDSSGELFGNGGDPNWASDVSEAARNSSKEEKECLVSGCGAQFGNLDAHVGADSGYGSEPGYRGDAELGYGDEFDEEEEDARPLFWGHRSEEGAEDTKMEMVGENTLFTDQKTHYRCRRKKHDCRMVDSLR
ncbi:unnamed protein product [Linum tenue]|uniref:Uncharacterized protein n=1 Tax=Linum tenue TaxID=586396 RepID=A0AAV0PGK4_9ROSI|nr:unnamed protein product [Linum tenue]